MRALSRIEITEGPSRSLSSSHVMWAERMAMAGSMTNQLTGIACILIELCGVN